MAKSMRLGWIHISCQLSTHASACWVDLPAKRQANDVAVANLTVERFDK